MGISQNASLQSIRVNGASSIRPARTENQVLIQAHLTTISLSDIEDETFWFVNDVEWKKYNTGAVYNLIKQH